MARMNLKAQVRPELGTRNVRRLRRSGIIPAVIYGDISEAMALGVDGKELHRILRGKGGEHAIIDLQVAGLEKPIKKTVIVKEVQRDNLKDAIIHVDFAAISMTEKLVTKVAIVRHGDPVGVTMGGILEQIVRELEVECLPADLPEQITVDVSALKIGDSVKVSDVKAPEGVKIMDEPGLTLFTVSVPKLEKVEEPAAAEAAAEGAPAEGAPAEGAPAEGEEKEGAKGKAKEPAKEAEKEGAKGKGKGKE